MNITGDCAHDQPTGKVAELPGAVVGNKIHFEGTVNDINTAMKKVFFYAPQGTNGNITFTVTVSDAPLACESLDRSLLPTHPNNFVQRPSRAFCPLPMSTVICIAAASPICDRNISKTTVAYCRSMWAVNQAPSIEVDPEFYPKCNLTRLYRRYLSLT